MKRIQSTFVAILMVLICTTQGKSQTQSIPKNNIHGDISFVGLGAGASLNYERTINYNMDRAILQQINAMLAGIYLGFGFAF